MLLGNYTGIERYESSHAGISEEFVDTCVCLRQSGHMCLKATYESQH